MTLFLLQIYVTGYEKTGLIYIYIYKIYVTKIHLFMLQYISPIQNSIKLVKLEIKKCSKILHAHKPYFLISGHNMTSSGSKISPKVCASVSQLLSA